MSFLLDCLLWLDRHPAWHCAVAWTSFALLVASALGSVWAESAPSEQPARRRPPLGHPVAFVFLVLATLAAFRWPSWFDTQLGNPDEAQMIAGAITLARYPVYWGSVDGTTHGPLCDYVLLLPKLLGAPVNFVSARIVALLLEGFALLGLWRALRRHVPESLARAAVLPGVAFWSFTGFFDFVEYSSELAVIALAAAAAWSAVAALEAKPGRWRMAGLFGTGVLAGLIPFAKLQGGPLLLALLAFAGIGIVRCRQLSWRQRLLEVGTLAAGTAAVGLLVVAFVSLHGLWGGFWQTYVLNNLAYADARHQSASTTLGALFSFKYDEPMFTPFFAGCLAAALAGLLPALWAWRKWHPVLLTTWLLFAASVVAVAAPGRDYSHYLHLLIVPASALAAVHAAACAGFIASFPQSSRAGRIAPLLVLLALAVLPQVIAAEVGNELLGRLPRHLETRASPAARRILRDAGADDRMAMWGWMPHLYVETGLPQATREAHTHWQIERTALQDYYRRRYLRDITRSRPRWFVDAVGGDNFAYKDRASQGHEIFPELAALVAAHYQLIDEVDGYRIYRRIDER